MKWGPPRRLWRVEARRKNRCVVMEVKGFDSERRELLAAVVGEENE